MVQGFCLIPLIKEASDFPKILKIGHAITGWWFQPPWKILVRLDHHPNYFRKIKNVPNHQPVQILCSMNRSSHFFLILPQGARKSPDHTMEKHGHPVIMLCCLFWLPNAPCCRWIRHCDSSQYCICIYIWDYFQYYTVSIFVTNNHKYRYSTLTQE